MKIKQLLATTATTVLLLTPAHSAIKLDEIVVKGPTWNPIDSGRNDYNSRQINTYLTPAQDFKDLFRTDANVQFNDNYKRHMQSKAPSDGDTTREHSLTNTQQRYTQKVLDQRPASISISGGRFYENNLTVDGRYSSSRLTPNLREVNDKDGATVGDINGPRRAGTLNRTSDSFWVKPFDVEKAKIYDSNIPAKYGKFSGGVMDVTTKKPTGKQKFTFYYDVAGSKWEETKFYNMTPNIQQKWTSYNIGGRFNSNEYTIKDGVKMSLAVAQDRGKRTAVSPPSDFFETLGGVPNKMHSISKNQDIKGKFKFRHDTEVDVTLNNQKYSIENFPDGDGNGTFNNLLENKFSMDIQKRLGNVMAVNVNKKLTGGRTVNVTFSDTNNTMERTSLTGWDLYHHKYGFLWSGGKYTHGSFSPKNCGTTPLIVGSDYGDCETGGYGDADEKEKKRSVNLTYGMPSKWGRLEFGTSLEHDNLQFNRNQDSHRYSYLFHTMSGAARGKFNTLRQDDGWGGYDENTLNRFFKDKAGVSFGGSGSKYEDANLDSDTKSNLANIRYLGDSVKCETESKSCETGSHAFYYRTQFKKKNVKFTGTERNAYMQLTRKLENGIKMRAGVRYDYDTLLKNQVFAPRLSLNQDVNLMGHTWKNTYGLNRYYANSNATYHLLGKAVGENTKQYRVMKHISESGASNIGKTLWTDKWVDDETTTGNTYGYAGLKTPHKDELSVATQSPQFPVGQFRFKYIDRHGRNEFASVGNNPDSLNNKGWSKYRSLTVEYQKTWGPNSFFANTTFSSTKRNVSNFTSAPKENTNTSDLVVYKGQTYKWSDINKKAANYNKPQVYNFGYARNITVGSWGNVMAGITGRYTESYTKIGTTRFDNNWTAQDDTKIVGYNLITIVDGKKRYHDDWVEKDGCPEVITRKTVGGSAKAGATKNLCTKYSDVKYRHRLDINGRLTWNIARNGEDTGVMVYTGINNLFNKRYKGAKDGKPKQGLFRGRSFTFGTQVSF